MRQSGTRVHPDHQLQGSPSNSSTRVENFSRLLATGNLAIAATGVEHAVAIPLEQGDVVTNITFVVATTAAGTPTAGYAVLRSPAGAKLAQTADFGSTARAANTAYTVALTAAYTVTADGLYIVGISFTASTIPTLKGIDLGNASVAGAIGLSMPILAQTHGSSVGATAPSTIATPTTVKEVPYVVVT